MRKFILLVGLIVFLTPMVVNAEKSFLEKIYFVEEQFLGCNREFSFHILKKKILFFDLSKVRVDNGTINYFLKTNYFTDDLIKGEKDIYENNRINDQFIIHRSLPKPMVEYISIDQDGLITTNTDLECVNSYQLGIHCVMNPNNPRCTVGK